MNIVIAPDSFKNSLTALEVAAAMEEGIRRVYPKARCIKIPMADGGEGTVQTLVDVMGGKFVSRQVMGPDKKTVTARYGLLNDGETAVIEMAEASGLPLVSGAAKNPLKTTSYGTGELLIDAINAGARKIMIGLGGSATVDAGMGMAQALGVVFSDKHGRAIRQPGCGGLLDKIHAIDISGIHPGIKKTSIIILTDVTNTLYGKDGAAYVFGPQKGATPDMVKLLDTNLRYFGKLVRTGLGRNIVDFRGAGAAGGLGGGLMAFTKARVKNGFRFIAHMTTLGAFIEQADLVFTGEGRVDSQTALGKTPIGVTRIARRLKVPVIAIGGGLADDAGELFGAGISGLGSSIVRDMSLDEALDNAPVYLANAAERAMRLVFTGQRLARRKNRQNNTEKFNQIKVLHQL